MADILCRVCGEWWDAWGANHGDMVYWEYDLFKAGKGCSSCKGVRPENVDPDEVDRKRYRKLLINGPDNPDDFGLASAGLDPTPPGDGSTWIEPEEKVLWQCEGCGGRVTIDNDCPYDGSELDQSRVFLSYDGPTYPFDYDEDLPTREPQEKVECADGEEHVFCATCIGNCSQCGKWVFASAPASEKFVIDSTDVGASFPHSVTGRSICFDCMAEIPED